MTQTLAPLALALGLILVAGLASPDAMAQKKKKSAKAKAPPAPTACTDFYSVATADWVKAHPAPATRQRVGDGRTRRACAAATARPARRGDAAARRATCRSCSATSGPAAWTKPRSNATAPIRSRRCSRASTASSSAKDVAPAIAALHQVGIPVAFNFGADIDLRDLARHIGYFSQGGLGLPDPAFYTRTDADTQAL